MPHGTSLPSGVDDWEPAHTLKVFAVGGYAAGKTALLRRFMDKTYTGDDRATLGVDFRNHHMMLGGQAVKLQLWETSGFWRNLVFAGPYSRMSHGIMLVYDITSMSSFEEMKRWHKEVAEHAPEVPYLVVGVKADMADRREVAYETGKVFADELGAPYFEASAKDGTNVEAAFMALADRALMYKLSLGDVTPSRGVVSIPVC